MLAIIMYSDSDSRYIFLFSIFRGPTMRPLNLSDLRSLDFAINRAYIFMELFNTNVTDTVIISVRITLTLFSSSDTCISANITYLKLKFDVDRVWWKVDVVLDPVPDLDPNPYPGFLDLDQDLDGQQVAFISISG